MEFEFPNPLPTGVDELRELRVKAVDAFNALYKEGETPSEDEFARMKYITDGIGEVDAKIEEYTAAESRAAEAAGFAAQVNAEGEDDGDGEEETTDPGDGEESGDGESGEEGGEEDGTTPGDGEEGAAVAASGGRTKFSRAASGSTPKVPAPERGFRLTTSAQNFESGVVDSLRVAEEFGHLAQGRAARVIGAGGRSETTLAYLERSIPDEFNVGDEADAIRVLEDVTDESRLPGGSLVAAGGWVSPSETVYDFLPVQAPTGLLSLPEIGVRRGGIKFPVEPDFSAIYNEIGFTQTEAQAQAGEEKPCWEIPETGFREVRLGVEGVCITNGILQDKAWPELTRKFVDEALRLHQHKISARRISEIVRESPSVGTLTGPMFGTTGAVLSALELQVADLRQRHRIPRTQSVEGIAPEWILSVLRADLAYRDSVMPQQVTDEQIRAHFRNLGANLQFVTDWQNDVIGGETPATGWPETVEIVLYPAGTWWSAVEPVVNFGIIHDSTLLKQNKQVQLFTEDGVAVGKRGPESRRVSIPVSVDGTVGGRYAPAEAVAEAPAA